MTTKKFNVKYGLSVGSSPITDVINENGNATFSTLTVSGTSNLGNVGNVNVSGGSNGQFLQTNGSGNLSWSTVNNVANANYAAFAGEVVDASQPNITSLGVLNNLTVATTIYADGYAARTGSDLPISTAGNGNIVLSPAGTGIVQANSNVSVNGTLSANAVSGNGAALSNITGANVTGTVANANYAAFAGEVVDASQPNITSLGTLSGLTVNGTSNLGAVGNVVITGGSNGQVLTTNGNGVLSWNTQSEIANGTSSVEIPAANGNIEVVRNGTSHTIFTASGLEVVGNLDANNLIIASNANVGDILTTTTLSVGGNANVGDQLTVTGTATVGNLVSNGVANVGSLITSTDANVGSNLEVTGWANIGSNITVNADSDLAANVTVGGDLSAFANVSAEFGTTTLLDLVVTGTSNLGDVANVTILGGSNNQYLQTDGNGVLSWGTLVSNPDQIINGNSNVVVTLNGNVTTSVGGVGDVFVVTQNGVNVNGTLEVSGVSYLGDVGNVNITGGNSGEVLTTDGTGNLTWEPVGGVLADSIENGNSNVFVVANGNVNTSVGGVANVLVVTSTGANLNGDLAVTGNIDGDNLITTGVANVGSLTVNGVSNLGDVSNVIITGGTTNQYLRTNGSGGLSWGDGKLEQPMIEFTGNAGGGSSQSFVNANLVNFTSDGYAMVFVNGVLQSPTDYDIAGNTLTMTSYIPPNAMVTVGPVSGFRGLDGNAAAGGSVTQLQYNDTGTLNGISTVTTDGNVVTFQSNGAIKIGGGSNGQVLSTDGSGNLSWVTGGSGGGNIIQNGNSNVFVVANGNVNTSVGGVANVFTVSSTGMRVTGTSNLGLAGNVRILGGSNGQVLSTNGSGNLSWVSRPSNIVFWNTDTGYTGTTLSVDSANAAIRIQVAGVAYGNIGASGNNVSLGYQANASTVNALALGPNAKANAQNAVAIGFNSLANVSNTIVLGDANSQVKVTGNLVVAGLSNLGPVGNVTITGGTPNQYLQTDGAGNLTWADAQLEQPMIEFTGNVGGGSNQSFVDANLVSFSADNYAMVFVNGVLQSPSDYDLSGNTLTVTSYLPASAMVMVGPISGFRGLSYNQAPAFSAYANSTTQTIATNTQTKVLFQTEEFDTNNNFANSRFTPTVPGYYQLNAEVRFEGASGTGETMIMIWKNGTEIRRGTSFKGVQIATDGWAMTVSSLVYADGASDYFEIAVQQGSGSNLNLTTANTSSTTWFNGSMTRGA